MSVKKNHNTDTSFDELRLRLFAAANAIDYYNILKEEPYGSCEKCRSSIKRDDKVEHKIRNDGIRHILFQYAIIQIYAVLDSSGFFSLRIETKVLEGAKKAKKYTVSKNRLKNLFPTYKEDDIKEMKKRIDKVLYKRRLLIRNIRKMRNSAFAHMGEKRFKKTGEPVEYDWDLLLNYHYYEIPKSVTPFKVLLMINELENAITEYY